MVVSRLWNEMSPAPTDAYSSALPRIALLAVAAAEALYALALRTDAWLARPIAVG